jgi:hypothetical protein
MLGSVVDRTHEFGVFVANADAHIEGSVVRETSPQVSDQKLGYGMSIQPTCVAQAVGVVCDDTTRSNVTLLGSLVERSYDIGVLVADSDAHIEASVVRLTSPRAADGRLGDGVIVEGGFGPSSLNIVRARIEESARAGLSNFGAFVSLESTRIHCAAFELAGESYNDKEFTFEDRGGNQCGCPDADHACKSVSVGLEPPTPLAGAE